MCTAIPTAGAPTRRSSTRPCRAGSYRSPPSKTACSSSTKRSHGCPSTCATARSASGSTARVTGRSAATATGARRCRSGRATTRATRASTCTAASTSSSATSGGVPPTCTGRRSTSSRARTPTTPRANRRCVASPTSSTAGSSRGRCPSHRCITRSRTPTGSTRPCPATSPFHNSDWFESPFPGDFIVESIGQPRGWFYTLHVLATALFDKPAFSTCLVHGILVGDDGQKLSKRLGNYPDPVDVFDSVGSDAMRWALLSSTLLRGGDMQVDRRAMEEAVRHVLMPIWNAWYFLSLYANAGGVKGSLVTDADHMLDRYALAKVRALVEDVTVRLDAYDLSGACASVLSFLDSLNNWYIRRSRDRFWAGDPDAVNTLHTVLATLCRVGAPLLPMATDAIYRDLTGAPSVHLERWP